MGKKRDVIRKLKNRKAAATLLFAVFNAIGYVVVKTNVLKKTDRAVMTYIENRDKFVTAANIISTLGSYKGYMGLFAILAISTKYRKENKRLLIKYIILVHMTALSNQVFKMLYQRIRPEEFFKILTKGYSFPSGHTMVLTATLYYTAYIMSKDNEDKKLFFYLTANALIMLMGWSRIYLGVHWITDVIGGYVGGYIAYMLFRSLENKIDKEMDVLEISSDESGR